MNLALEFSAGKLEAIDLAMVEAEIADQQMIGELAETCRRQGHSPRRGEVVAVEDLLNEISVLVKNGDRSRTWICLDLVFSPNGRISYEDIAVDIAHVKGSQSWAQFGVQERPGP